MSNLLSLLSGSPSWIPYGSAFQWDPRLLWLIAGANGLIALAYLSIAFTLVVLILKHRGLTYKWLFWGFVAFILGSGLTHLARVWTIWQPVYGVQAGIDVLTAAASVVTAVALWPLLPGALSMPTRSEMQQTIARLEEEIDGRKRVEAALRHSEERFRQLLESAPDGIVVIDDTGHIQLINSQAGKMFGYRREEMVGEAIEILVPDGLRDAHRGHRRRYTTAPVTRPMGINLDLFARRKDGSQFPVEISLSPLKSPDELSIVSIIRDVSERRRIQASIQALNHELQNQNQQLAAANAELESFSYSVSHDLRAPLRSLDGFSRILLEDYADEFPEGARHYLERMRHNAQKMDHLIQALLAFSRLGRQPLKLEPVNLHALTQEVWQSLADDREDREVAFVLNPLPQVEADPMLLRSVMANLIGNALKYTRGCGEARIEVGAVAENGSTAIYVKDNGVGFDMKYIDKLFGVFQRLHRVEDYEGTGVGLATAQRIIHRHGGKIWAEAEVGEGAIFTFTLEGGTTS